jgi:hypothetical protein
MHDRVETGACGRLSGVQLRATVDEDGQYAFAIAL